MKNVTTFYCSNFTVRDYFKENIAVDMFRVDVDKANGIENRVPSWSLNSPDVQSSSSFFDFEPRVIYGRCDCHGIVYAQGDFPG